MAAVSSKSKMSSRQKWTLALTSVTSFMISLDSLVVSTALPTIHRALHASLATLEWTVNAYNLTFAVLLLTGAAVGDRFGRRRMFLAGLAIFTAASAVCAMAPDISVLIMARAAQGCGAAFVMPLALTQLTAAFPPRQRGRALGIFSGATGLATLSGPLIGGAVAQGLAWQWIFWLNLPFGLITIVASAARLPESHGPGGLLDLPGVLLVTAGALGIVWSLVRGGEVGWNSAEVIAVLSGGTVLIAAFIYWESRAQAPMLQLSLFRNRIFTLANIAIFCLFGSLYGTTFMLAQYLQNGVGYSPLAAGLRLAPWTATLLVFAPAVGYLTDRFGERPFMIGGLAMEASGLLWLSAIASPHVAYLRILAPLLITGIGNSLTIPAIQKAVVGSVHPTKVGQASGVLNMLRIFGGVFGIAILGAVFAASGSYATAQAFTSGFRPAIGAAGVLSCIGLIAALALPGVRGAAISAMPEAEPPIDLSAGKEELEI